MKHVSTAADLRAVVEKVMSSVLERERPATRIGRVYSFNRETSTAMVLFPGNTIDGLVPVSFGKNMIPSVAMIDTFATDGYAAAGDVVRVDGRPNDWYVSGFSVGLPVSEHAELTAGTNFGADWLEVTSTGNQVIPLSHIPIIESVHIYQGGTYLPDFDWGLNDDGMSITVLDPGGRIKVGRKLGAKYAWIAQAPPLPGDPVMTEFTVEFPVAHIDVYPTVAGGPADAWMTADAGDTRTDSYAHPESESALSGHFEFTWTDIAVPSAATVTSAKYRIECMTEAVINNPAPPGFHNATYDDYSEFDGFDPIIILGDASDHVGWTFIDGSAFVWHIPPDIEVDWSTIETDGPYTRLDMFSDNGDTITYITYLALIVTYEVLA